jgi:hypothetical protein
MYSICFASKLLACYGENNKLISGKVATWRRIRNEKLIEKVAEPIEYTRGLGTRILSYKKDNF